VRGNIPLPERTEPGRTDQTLGSLVHALLLSWAFVLYLCSRALALLNKPLRRLGVPANGLMIRLYRTRRKLADRLIESDPAAAQTASAG